MRQLLFLLFILMTLPYLVLSQNTEDKARGGSMYSSIGIGMPVDLSSSLTDGMGVRGVSVYDPYTANMANPALWGISSLTRGSVTAGFQSLGMKDNFDTARYSSLRIDQFQLILPVIKSKLGLSVSFTPLTRTNYSLFRSSAFEPEPDSDRDPIQVLNNIDGSGGINRLEIGLGYRLNTYLSVGYAGSVNITTLDRDVAIFFDSPRFNTIEYTDRISGIESGHRFGIFGGIPSLFGDNDELSIGAALSLPVRIAADRSTETSRLINNVAQTVEFFEDQNFGPGVVEVPLELNVGLSYYVTPVLSVSAEYLDQRWSRTEFSYNPEEEQYYVDRTKIGGGLQYQPYFSQGANGFFENIRYSAGASFDSGHLKIDGRRIETLMFNAGFGIISQAQYGFSSVDVSFQFGYRGTEMHDLVREKIWGIRLSLNLGESMFVPPRFN